MTASGLPPLREVIRAHELAANKRLGQHFLLDPSILRRIVAAAAPLAGSTVLEVGPGPGGLTRALLDTDAARVVAVEQDRRCIAALQPLAVAYGDRFELVAADARTFDICSVAPTAPVTIVANLPYNIGTELLIGWLKGLGRIERMILMFQKEVAARIVAVPNTSDWGRLGVLTQALCRAERLFDLPPAAFVPPPKVVSTVVRLTPRPDRPRQAEIDALERVTRAAFGQRRKMLRTALRSLVPDPLWFLEAVGIAPTRRAETLDLREYLALASILPAHAGEAAA